MNSRQCINCLYTSDHPFGLTFNKDGVCSGCTTHAEKFSVDWIERQERLNMIVKPYKSKAIQRNYDCIVPVEGNAASYYVLHLVKNILGMNPLCVHYNSHFTSAVGFWNLANLRIKFDVDLVSRANSKESIRKIVRHTLSGFQSIYWHVIAGRTSFPVQVARDYRIPLIIWGCHQGLDQTGMFSHFDEVEMTERYRHNFDLMKLNPLQLMDNKGEINHEDISTFIYPDNCDIDQIGIRGIYLNNYFKWDQLTQHSEMNKLYGCKETKNKRILDTYENSDCLVYNDYHDFLKYHKIGYTKLTDQLNREIRFNRISKNNAIRTINKQNSNDFNNLKLISDFLESTSESLLSVGYIFRGLKDRKKIDEYFSAVNDMKESKNKKLNVFEKGYP